MQHQSVVTTNGFPIVDGKYIDEKGTLQLADSNQPTRAGPPAVALYWHNGNHLGVDDRFQGFTATAFVDVTKYLRRLGDFLKMGSCSVGHLIVTEYAVGISVAADLSTEEMMARSKKCNLFPAFKTSTA